MAKKRSTKTGRKKRYTKKDIEVLLPTIEEWGREGLIDSEIARRMGISLSTLYNYKNEYPILAEALNRAKAEADFVIKESLYKKAKGFFYEEIEEILNDEGEVLRTKRIRKYSPPDTKAAQMWLQNREPDEWREKKDLTIEQDLVIDVSFVDGDADDE